GERAKVEKVLLKHPALEQISSGPMKKVLLDAVYSTELKRKAQEQGFTIEKAGMQDYLLGVTSKEEVLV
ncbi:MAG: ABC transporter ATP-binding protein, partial [Dethiobacteria bacterium]|nr:ABC transporter ATP-binding protein [Dethiobacteria bacterium]